MGIRLKNWNTKPTWSRRKSVLSRGVMRFRHAPATKTSPALGWSMPATRLRIVALAAAAASADGEELALFDGEVGVLQDVAEQRAFGEVLGDAIETNECEHGDVG